MAIFGICGKLSWTITAIIMLCANPTDADQITRKLADSSLSRQQLFAIPHDNTSQRLLDNYGQIVSNPETLHVVHQFFAVVSFAVDSPTSWTFDSVRVVRPVAPIYCLPVSASYSHSIPWRRSILLLSISRACRNPEQVI